ncbi:hypothetical protein KL912_002166 [Ogataea haglerorum]|nr:hypothetical protein KL912_002166 [Ogataea haglerorum]KAG7759785.1 hypothetical protein KL947_001415 [Ogataea haglerorum]
MKSSLGAVLLRRGPAAPPAHRERRGQVREVLQHLQQHVGVLDHVERMCKRHLVSVVDDVEKHLDVVFGGKRQPQQLLGRGHVRGQLVVLLWREPRVVLGPQPVHVDEREQHLAETAHGDAQETVLAVLQVQRQAVLDHEPQHVVAQRVLDVAEPEHVICAART